MIDDTVILFSTGMCLFILLRAIRLDSLTPWFGVRKSLRYDGLQAPPEAESRPRQDWQDDVP